MHYDIHNYVILYFQFYNLVPSKLEEDLSGQPNIVLNIPRCISLTVDFGLRFGKVLT